MKINFKALGRKIVKFGKRAAPAASIAVGVGCTAVAAYKTAKAIPVAKQHIEEKKEELGKEKLTIVETAQACGKDFVEPFIFGTTGLAAVTIGVCDYEKTIKDLGTTVGVATALLNEQSKEMKNVLGEEKAAEVQQKAAERVVQAGSGNGARIPTPGGSDIFIEELTGREYLSSESWIRECFSAYMDDFVDNPDDRPTLSVFYDMLAPNVKRSGAPICSYMTFPYDTSKPGKYNRVYISFVPAETVDGKAAFMFKYSQPVEVAYSY